MCEIRRINSLKAKSRIMTTNFKEVDPLSLLPKNYVSNTGLTFTDLSDKIDKVSDCSSIIELKEEFKETKDGLEQVMKLSAANFCKQHAVCPVCSDRFQSRRRARFNDSIREQARQVEESLRFAYMITYTITDGPDLSERLEALKAAKREFRRMGQKRKRGRSGGEAGKINAAIATIEIKRGENSGEWHVHSHDLVFCSEPLDYKVYDSELRKKLEKHYGNRRVPKEELTRIANRKVIFRGELVPASKLSSEWFAASGGDSIGIDVEPIRHVPKNCSGKKKRMYRKMSFADSIAYQSKECLKYPYKMPYREDAGDLLEVLSGTYNKRMVATYGEFRGVGGDDYADPAADDQQTYVLVWDDQKKGYGEPIPAKLRDIIEGEETTKTRSEAGKALGVYRRQRRLLIEKAEQYGESLYYYLDSAKRQFKMKINAIWSLYRQRINADFRLNNARCDKYSPVMALKGAYFPGSDSRDIYAAAFS